jgi:signal transduction histidine kinase/CheY-like chemotaxis protein/PAS domain-containing protein
MPLEDDQHTRSAASTNTSTSSSSESAVRPASIATSSSSVAAATPGRPASPGILAKAISRRERAALVDTQKDVEKLVGEWGTEISHYGLTASTVARDKVLPTTETKDHTSPAATRHSPPNVPTSGTGSHRPGILQGKRPSDEVAADTGTLSPPPPKRPRFVSPRDFDLGGFTRGTANSPFQAKREGPASPLFFSNTPSHMATRPSNLGFSSSEATATMLNRLREEPEVVTTVRLPRGNVSSTSPARSGSTPGSWSSTDAAGASRSPDSRVLPPGLQLLQGIGVIELLEQDDRPTFIVDLASPTNVNRPGLHLLYANASLRASQGLLELLSVESHDAAAHSDFTQFKAWIMSYVNSQESMDVCLPSVSYGGLSWTCSTVRKRFRFISGNGSAISVTPASPTPLAQESAVLEQRNRGPTPSLSTTPPLRQPSVDPDYFGDAEPPMAIVDGAVVPLGEGGEMDEDTERIDSDKTTRLPLQSQTKDSFDWTRIPLSEQMPEHILFARSVDWASTPLGPIEDWSRDLRVVTNMIMGSPHPAAMYWGPEYVTLYNAAYVEIAGKKHPKLMGQRYQEAWPELWANLEPLLRSCYESGQSVMKQENQLFINRHGFHEEAFFSWSVVPLVGGDGSVAGLYNPVFESTRRKVAERRMHILREVGEKTALAKDVRGFWPQLKTGLEHAEFDVPFALIYSVREEQNESETSSMHSGSLTHPPQIFLEGSLGVPAGHAAAVSTLDLRTSEEGYARYMRESMTMAGAPVVLSKETGNLPTDLIVGLEPRGFGDPCSTVVVFPVHPTTVVDTAVGFVVLGVNPRRPYDDEYQLFIHLLSRQLATSMASVVLFEEEIKRGQRAARLAALDRQELSMQLYLRTQEAVESEYKFTRMAAFAPVGMFIADHGGLITYSNDMWWEISRHPRSPDNLDTWMDSARDEDREGLELVWRKLINQKVPITHEFRFKGTQQSGDHIIDTWVLMAAYPEKDDSGDLNSIFGCITDISSQKWAETFQKQRREEAVELKRQQENFIDITSHEMRNPLSAILQCADEINNSIDEFRANGSQLEDVETLFESCTDAANIINLCASHQKRIVDDILTLSKLDSQLLLVTPVDAQPVFIVRNVLKMFESELNTHGIVLDFQVEKSYSDFGITWVKLDPSRLRQVLINLMTNAIKFTQNREKRAITVRLGASKDVSEAAARGITYFPSRRDDLRDITSEKEWGHGDKVNLHLAVQDTGPGLGEDETKLLFQRFSQASPRTHVQYGGSGLGLFISRILTELQGGQIGVTSTKGVGSTFNFYVKSRRCENPPAESGIISALNLARPVKSDKTASALLKGTLQRQASVRKQVDGGLPPLDVLIVEDNLVNQKVLQKQLRNCGNNTHVANHGGEALDTLRNSRFWAGREANGFHISIILMDLEMPVMDGMTCARRIRELERDGVIVQHIPIIAVTAYARPEQIESAKAAGIVREKCFPACLETLD